MKKNDLLKIVQEEINNFFVNEKIDFSVSKEEQELYKLKKQFLPAFQEYVSSYDVYSAEGTEGDSYFNDPEYSEAVKQFAKELKSVLFKLENGEF